MKKSVLVLVFGCVISLAKSEINYLDCGSSFEITTVEVQNCTRTPCRISVGETRTITVNSKNLVPDVEAMESRAYIAFMGHQWELNVTPNDPCVDWGCPLRETMLRTYKGDVQFSDTLMRRPAYLTLSTTFDSPHGQEVAFCISFYVDIVV